MADAIGLLCVLGLVAVLGGGVAIMLYGVKGVQQIIFKWFGRT